MSVPEALIHPSDLGLMEKGIAEAVLESCEAIPEDI